jgi:hypothetical protein
MLASLNRALPITYCSAHRTGEIVLTNHLRRKKTFIIDVLLGYEFVNEQNESLKVLVAYRVYLPEQYRPA